MPRPGSWLCFILFLAAGCDSYYFHGGRFLEETGRQAQALKSYRRFLERRPADPRAAELHVRAGRLYAGLQRCLEARRHFEAAARGFPGQARWAALARVGIMDCPDYFPLGPGRYWVYGDSQSLGRNMRLEWELRASTDGARSVVLSSLFAGNKRIRLEEFRYEKRDWAVWEEKGAERAAILRYPFSARRSWRARRGREEFEYSIESDEAAAKTAAGLFRGCLKVREKNPRFPGFWKYDYYAPFVGRVKTTVAGPGFENPNTELLKYGP